MFSAHLIYSSPFSQCFSALSSSRNSLIVHHNTPDAFAKCKIVASEYDLSKRNNNGELRLDDCESPYLKGRTSFAAITYFNDEDGCEKLLIFGGKDRFSFTNCKELHELCFKKLTWKTITPKNPFPQMILFYSSAALRKGKQQQMVLFGGIDGVSSSNMLCAFNIVDRSWESLPSTNPPCARCNCSLMVSKDQSKLYVFGGYSESPQRYLTDLHEYSFSTGCWREMNIIGATIREEFPNTAHLVESPYLAPKVVVLQGHDLMLIDLETSICSHVELCGGLHLSNFHKTETIKAAFHQLTAPNSSTSPYSMILHRLSPSESCILIEYYTHQTKRFWLNTNAAQRSGSFCDIFIKTCW